MTPEIFGVLSPGDRQCHLRPFRRAPLHPSGNMPTHVPKICQLTPSFPSQERCQNLYVKVKEPSPRPRLFSPELSTLIFRNQKNDKWTAGGGINPAHLDRYMWDIVSRLCNHGYSSLNHATISGAPTQLRASHSQSIRNIQGGRPIFLPKEYVLDQGPVDYAWNTLFEPGYVRRSGKAGDYCYLPRRPQERAWILPETSPFARRLRPQMLWLLLQSLGRPSFWVFDPRLLRQTSPFHV